MNDSATTPNATQSPQSIGPYSLIEQIGSGGMGDVWRARRTDGHLDREVAIKRIALGMRTMAMRERFTRERKILEKLNHPNIARLYDAGVSDAGQPYLVLECVEGERIDLYCDHRKLAITARVRLFLQVLSAVAHAHQHLVVHRDLKPGNVLVTPDGEVKLLDFGISKLLEETEGQSDLTRDAGRILTPEYAAPEQLTLHPITTASDVYSLGVLLYHLLTGCLPYGAAAAAPAALVRAIIETEPTRASVAAGRVTRVQPEKPAAQISAISGTFLAADAVADNSTGEAAADAAAEANTRDVTREIRALRRATSIAKLRSHLSGDLDNILAKALRKDPYERYASVQEFAQDLLAYLELKPVKAQPDSVAYRARKFMQRNRGAVAAGALCALAILGGVASTAWQAIEARKQAAIARAEMQKAEAIRDYLVGIFRSASRDVTEFPKRGETTTRELLDSAAQRVETAFPTQPALRGFLYETLSGVYFDLDQLPQALTTAQRWEAGLSAGSLSASPSIERAPAIAALVQQGVTLTRMGRAKEALEVLTRARDIASLRSQPHDELWARIHLALALLHAEEYSHDAAATSMAEVGRVKVQSPSLVIERAYVEGLSDLRRGKLRSAKEKMTTVVKGLEVAVGSKSVRTAEARWRLGVIAYYRGDWIEAEAALRSALDTIQAVSGQTHRDTIVIKRELANVLVRQGKWPEAFKLADESLLAARVRAKTDPNHMYLASVLQSWGRTRLFAGDIVGADLAFSEALSSVRRTSTEEQFEAFMFFDLAQTAFLKGNLKSAKNYAEKVVAAYTETQGKDSIVTVTGKLTMIEAVQELNPDLANKWWDETADVPMTEFAFPAALLRAKVGRIEAAVISKLDLDLPREIELIRIFSQPYSEIPEVQFRLAQTAVLAVIGLGPSADRCAQVISPVATIRKFQVEGSRWVNRTISATAKCKNYR